MITCLIVSTLQTICSANKVSDSFSQISFIQNHASLSGVTVSKDHVNLDIMKKLIINLFSVVPNDILIRAQKQVLANTN